MKKHPENEHCNSCWATKFVGNTCVTCIFFPCYETLRMTCYAAKLQSICGISSFSDDFWPKTFVSNSGGSILRSPICTAWIGVKGLHQVLVGVKGLHQVLVGMDHHHPVLDGEILVMLSMWRSNVQDQRWPMLCQCAALVSYFGQCLFAYWVGMKWIMFANIRASSMVKRWQKSLVVNPGATGIRIWWSTCLVPSMKTVCRCSPLQALEQEDCKMQSLLDLLLDPSMLRCINV